MGHGTGDEQDGNLISRVEKRFERAQEEIGGEGNGVEEEEAGERDEESIGAASL